VLRGLGYGIVHTRDGYAFENAPVVPSLSLTIPEVLTLALAADLARDGDVDTATLGAVMAKLEALMPRDALALLRRDLAARVGDDGGAAQRTETLRIVQQARLQGRRVRITYETAMRGGARTERVVEPYHVQRHYNRFWMLTAYDHRRGAVIDFKLNRIHAAELLDERYTVPADFDIVAYRGGTWGLLRGEAGAPVDIELLFSAEAGRWVQEEDWSVPLTVEPCPDGSVRVRLRAGITPEMVKWILGYGPDCRVLTPDTLRNQVHTIAEATVELYGNQKVD